MNIRDIFEQTSCDWVKYSDYEIVTEDDMEWITPTVDSKLSIYNPLQAYDTLIQDMLNVGRLICAEELPRENKKNLILGLIKTYGLLGFMTAIPLNANFMEYPHVFFGRNNYFNVDMMETSTYLTFFQPFGVKKGQPKIDNYPIPVTMLTGKTLEYSIVFSRNYAEPMEWIEIILKEYYIHFSACKNYNTTENPAIKSLCEKRISSFYEFGLGFNIKMDEKPTMVWDFNSLKATIETVYAFSISAKKPLLKMCRQCGKAFYAPHGRSEFCSDKCRNQFNVYKFREKEKQNNRNNQKKTS